MELEGTGEPGTTVTLYDGDQVVAETVVAPDGTWTMTVPPLTAGTHSLAAKTLGADGKEQAASAPIELTVADGQIVVTTPARVSGGHDCARRGCAGDQVAGGGPEGQ